MKQPLKEHTAAVAATPAHRCIFYARLLVVTSILGFAPSRGAAAEGSGAKPASLPFVIFGEKDSSSNHYAASGWMGNTKAIRLDEGWSKNPHSGKTCLRCEHSGGEEWAGVAWQDPANDWGDQDGGWDLSGAHKLTFWARGEKGGETVSFKFGVLAGDKKFSDSATGALNDVKLTREWKEYSMELQNKDLTRIKTGFVWSVAGQGAPVVFYLDDIRFE